MNEFRNWGGRLISDAKIGIFSPNKVSEEIDEYQAYIPGFTIEHYLKLKEIEARIYTASAIADLPEFLADQIPSVLHNVDTLPDAVREFGEAFENGCDTLANAIKETTK